jgi:hypothetical protein
MFTSNKVSKSMLDAVNGVLAEEKKTVMKKEEKFMKKEEEVQPKKKLLLEPGKKNVFLKKFREEKDCVTEPRAKQIAKKEVKGHEKKMHHEEFSVEDFMAEDFSQEQLDEMLNEVLGKSAKAADWIHDFIHSDDPRFAGKSKKKRQQMALAAYYKKQRNEEVESVDEAWPGTSGGYQSTVFGHEKKKVSTGTVYQKKHSDDEHDGEHGDHKVEPKAQSGSSGSFPTSLHPSHDERGAKFMARQAKGSLVKGKAQSATQKEEVDLEEDTYGDTGWVKMKPKKDEFGNPIKNIARHLAKKGLVKAKQNKEKTNEEIELDEMDKSQTPSGRDGRVSHKTYGSRGDEDRGTGPEKVVKTITAKKAKRDALDILKKQGVAEEIDQVNEIAALHDYGGMNLEDAVSPEAKTTDTLRGRVKGGKENQHFSYKVKLKSEEKVDEMKRPLDGDTFVTNESLPLKLAKDAARKSFKRMRQETMMGKAGATSEEKENE